MFVRMEGDAENRSVIVNMDHVATITVAVLGAQPVARFHRSDGVVIGTSTFATAAERDKFVENLTAKS